MIGAKSSSSELSPTVLALPLSLSLFRERDRELDNGCGEILLGGLTCSEPVRVKMCLETLLGKFGRPPQATAGSAAAAGASAVILSPPPLDLSTLKLFIHGDDSIPIGTDEDATAVIIADQYSWSYAYG